LSKFIAEKNELKSNSIESKLCSAIIYLIRQRNENPNSQDYDGLDDCAFTNEQIWTNCKLIMDGTDIIGRSESFYSIDYGMVTHKKISGLIQSKFKAVPFKTSGDNSKRGWRFQKDAIDRIALQYSNEIKEIKILSRIAAQPDNDKTASDASDASHYKSPDRIFNEFSNDIQCQNTDQDSSSKPSTDQLVNNSSIGQNNTAAADIRNISNNDNSNYNIIEINSNNIKGSSLCTQTVPIPLSNKGLPSTDLTYLLSILLPLTLIK